MRGRKRWLETGLSFTLIIAALAYVKNVLFLVDSDSHIFDGIIFFPLFGKDFADFDLILVPVLWFLIGSLVGYIYQKILQYRDR